MTNETVKNAKNVYMKKYRDKHRERIRKQNRRHMDISRNGFFYISVRSDKDGHFYVKKSCLSKGEAKMITEEFKAVRIAAYYRPHIKDQKGIKK